MMWAMGSNGRHGMTVRLRSAGRTFPGGVEAVRDVSLEIQPGEFVALLGPSGCGKSTLLRLIAGLDQANTGSVEIEGDRAAVAYVFQDAHLLPWRTVLDNAVLPLELRRFGLRDRHERAARVLEQLGLAEALDRYPAQLSGGMRMRVSLARALVTDPKLLLLDEPFAALDEITRNRLDEMLRELWRARGMTVVFVTHSISEAVFLAERAVVFSSRPARVVADEAIDLPAERDVGIRSDARFGVMMARLHRALVEEETNA